MEHPSEMALLQSFEHTGEKQNVLASMWEITNNQVPKPSYCRMQRKANDRERYSIERRRYSSPRRMPWFTYETMFKKSDLQ
jgi:hypothetical protein